MLTPSTIKPAIGSKKTSKRLGRGNGSGKGTTAGRGGKGQTARSGGRSRTQIRAFKSHLQKVPKLRGFKSFYAKPQVLTLKNIEVKFNAGEMVTPATLLKKGMIISAQNEVKILATGEITKKLEFKNCLVSKKAAEMIEKAGGKVVF